MPPHTFDFNKKLSWNIAQIILYYHMTTWQNNFLLAWTDPSCAFDFRICFGKTLIAFDFDEKLTQCVAQLTNVIMCQKTFFPCPF